MTPDIILENDIKELQRAIIESGFIAEVGANVGTSGGVGVFSAKVANTFQFKNIKNVSDKLIITDNPTTGSIDIDIDESKMGAVTSTTLTASGTVTGNAIVTNSIITTGSLTTKGATEMKGTVKMYTFGATGDGKFLKLDATGNVTADVTVGAGDVTGSVTTVVDNTLVRMTGTSWKAIQGSIVSLSDTDILSGVKRIEFDTSENVKIGLNAATLATGSTNVCIGTEAGKGLTTGNYNVCVGRLPQLLGGAGENVCVGESAGGTSCAGFRNICVGSLSG